MRNQAQQLTSIRRVVAGGGTTSESCQLGKELQQYTQEDRESILTEVGFTQPREMTGAAGLARRVHWLYHGISYGISAGTHS